MSQEHAAARKYSAIVGYTNGGFLSGKECNISALHSSAEDLSGVQKCKNNGENAKSVTLFLRALENKLIRKGCQESCFFYPE